MPAQTSARPYCQPTQHWSLTPAALMVGERGSQRIEDAQPSSAPRGREGTGSSGSFSCRSQRSLFAAAVDVPVIFHGHNNLSTAVADSIAAVCAGATVIDGCARLRRRCRQHPAGSGRAAPGTARLRHRYRPRSPAARGGRRPRAADARPSDQRLGELGQRTGSVRRRRRVHRLRVRPGRSDRWCSAATAPTATSWSSRTAATCRCRARTLFRHAVDGMWLPPERLGVRLGDDVLDKDAGIGALSTLVEQQLGAQEQR